MAQYHPKILLVDDEPEARSSLAHALKLKGYEVIEVGTGEEALTHAKSDWPGLIILDVVLPDIPGTEVFKRLKQDSVTQSIPVLLLTAKPEIAESLPDYQEHADRAFEKPGRSEDLLKTIHEMLLGKK